MQESIHFRWFSLCESFHFPFDKNSIFIKSNLYFLVQKKEYKILTPSKHFFILFIYSEKARANGEEIAFKVLRPRSEDHLLEERQELIMMKYLSTYMDEVLKPKCGTKVHIFEVDGIEFRGIGMERNN